MADEWFAEYTSCWAEEVDLVLVLFGLGVRD